MRLPVEEKFFQIPNGTPDKVRQIVGEIRKQHQRDPFVVDLVKRAGFARWDKAQITSPKNRRGSENEESIIYIPFAFEDTPQVKAVLAINMTGVSGMDTVWADAICV